MTIFTDIVYYLMNMVTSSHFLPCPKAETQNLTVCIVVNVEQSQSCVVILTLIRACPNTHVRAPIFKNSRSAPEH